MKAIISFDGDLLVSDNQQLGIRGQINSIKKVTEQLGALANKNLDMLITHGNASQIGYMLLRSEAARHLVHSLPLDICGADTQGATGYMLQQAILNWFDKHDIQKDVVTIITQVFVEEIMVENIPNRKGIGPFFDWERKQVLIDKFGWEFEMVPGHGNQRVVPCLMPKQVVEINSIRNLFDDHVIVICAGGGGIPVRKDGHKGIVGVEAVIDKAYTTMLLAQETNPDFIVFVSPLERIINPSGLSPNSRSLKMNLMNVNKVIENKSGIEDTMLHKLIAIKQHLVKSLGSIFIVPLEQLGRVPNQLWGVEFTSGNI